MKKIKIINKFGNILDCNLVFSFHCTKTGKNYVALDYKKEIFEKNSSYDNLDIVEIEKTEGNKIYTSEILDSEWEDIKYALQYEIFANIKKS